MESDQRFQLPKLFSDSFGRCCCLIGTALNAWSEAMVSQVKFSRMGLRLQWFFRY